ncbi:MAG: hypothetical protein IJ817_01685 [Clostridia bacterium]|nr:hypothetical protein [Clostridia bacterium]
MFGKKRKERKNANVEAEKEMTGKKPTSATKTNCSNCSGCCGGRKNASK